MATKDAYIHTEGLPRAKLRILSKGLATYSFGVAEIDWKQCTGEYHVYIDTRVADSIGRKRCYTASEIDVEALFTEIQQSPGFKALLLDVDAGLLRIQASQSP